MDQDIYYEYDVKENGERDKVTIIMLGDSMFMFYKESTYILLKFTFLKLKIAQVNQL